MKKIIHIFLPILGFILGANGQCATTSAPTNNCYYGDAIDAFVVNGVASTGNAGCPVNGYNSFPSPVRTLTLGGTYAWSASVGGGSYNEGIGIWIDLNNDGNYANSEQVAASTAAALTHSGFLTIPFSATVANNIRMRVRCAWNTVVPNSAACTNNLGGYGETEDYFINIVCPSAPTLTISGTNSLLCAGQGATLTASGAQSYTWSGGITNAVTFTPALTTAYTVTGSINGCPSATVTAVRTITVTNVPLSINITASSPSICAGFSGTLTATGASNFTWTPGPITQSAAIVNPAATTIYTAFGYNGSGCPGASTIALGVNPSPTVNITASSPTACSGTSVNLTATGANNYTWTTGGSTGSSVVYNPTLSTIYLVTGSSNGCSSGGSQIILVSPNPTVTISSNKPMVCEGAPATLTASGANSYLWSTNASIATTTVNPLVTTTYSVAGTYSSSGCTTTKTITIIVFLPTLVVTPPSTAVCQGAQVTFAPSGSWTPNPPSALDPVTVPTVYTHTLSITAVSLGVTCKASTVVQLTVNPNPTVTASSTRTRICKGESTILDASGASNYVWSTNIGTVTATGNSVSVSPTSGVPLYSIIGTDANGCVGTANIQVQVNACVGITSNGGVNNGVSVYPNPNNGSFILESATDLRVNLVNEVGQLVRTFDLSGKNNHSINVTDLSKGVYFIVGQDENSGINQKVIVNK